jgi:hypothetical protein
MCYPVQMSVLIGGLLSLNSIPSIPMKCNEEVAVMDEPQARVLCNSFIEKNLVYDLDKQKPTGKPSYGLEGIYTYTESCFSAH